MNISSTLLWSGTCTSKGKLYYSRNASNFSFLVITTEFADNHFQTDLIVNNSSFVRQNIHNYTGDIYFHVCPYPTYLDVVYIERIGSGIKRIWGIL